MAVTDFIIDPAMLDLDRVLANTEAIRQVNPQRFEMEQLTAVIYEDADLRICAGYKDYTPDEFWIRGHMPGFPLVPGVLMCEAAAQLCSYCCQKFDQLGAKVMGFGGLDNVRFREPIQPGDRLVLVCQLLKARRGAMVVCRFQGFVRNNLVVEGQIRGVPLPDHLTATSGTLAKD